MPPMAKEVVEEPCIIGFGVAQNGECLSHVDRKRRDVLWNTEDRSN